MTPPHEKQVQIFAERCSGSNYLEEFIKRNLPQVGIDWEFGFKHWLPEKRIEHRDDLFFVLLARSPFDWLRSMHRRPWHAAPALRELDFSRFIRAEWSCIWDEQAGIREGDERWHREMEFERDPHTGRRFKNILEMRSVKHRIWLQIPEETENFLLVNHEDLVRDPVSLCSTLCRFMDIAAPGRVSTPKGYKGRMGRRRKLLFLCSFGLIGGYKARPRRPLRLSDIDFISDTLDVEVERSLGYDVAALAAQERMIASR